MKMRSSRSTQLLRAGAVTAMALLITIVCSLLAPGAALLAAPPQQPPAPDAPILDAAGFRALLPIAVGQRHRIDVVGWNVQSGGADPEVIAQRLRAFAGVDLWALAEVGADDADLYRQAVADGEGASFDVQLGSTGGGDRLLLLYNADRFSLLGATEMLDHTVQAGARAPLFAHLVDAVSGAEFLFMVNHLPYEESATRAWQAQQLNQWARAQSLPVVAAGDYNLRWSVQNGEQNHDAAYDMLTADGVWRWLRPRTLVSTRCGGWPCGFEEILDFVFVANGAQGWAGSSHIVVEPGDFPEDESTSDHRPVRAELLLP